MKKLLNRLLKPTLLTRMAIGLALVGLLPVGLLAYRLIGINRDAMEQQVQLTHTRAAGTIASRIGSEVATYLSLANGLAANPALGDARSLAVQNLLRANLQAWARLGVYGIAIVNPQGEQVILAQLPDEKSKQRVHAALETVTEDNVVAVIYRPDTGDGLGPPERELLLRIATPLPRQRGFVWIVADGRRIHDAVLHPEQLETAAEVTLAHHDGHAILGTLQGYPPEVLEHAASPWVEGVRESFRTADTALIGAFSPVEHTRWTVLSREPLEVAHAVAESMESEAKFAVGLVSAVIALLSALAYATVVRPVRQLAAAQRRLAGVSAASSSANEIDQLKASFEALEERIQDRDALDEVFLGRYQVRGVIGSGAMGTVFLGYDPKLQRPVALKTIRLDQKLGTKRREQLMTRLLQEAVTTAKFNHPNIVAIYDVEDRGGSAFMAMEYIDGASLETVVWQRGKMDPEQVMLLGAAVARGLSAAHKNQLVHRDVKPANVLLGKDGSIKVTDFGIAELVSSITEDEDVVFGTPGYLPPETLQGKGYDASGDLFSLGCVLYFALTGERPFAADQVKDVLRKTLFGSVTPPSRVVPNVPRDLEALIMSMLSGSRATRPKDASVVAERLERMAYERQAHWRPPAGDLQATATDGVHEHQGAALLPTKKLTAYKATTAQLTGR